MPVKRSTVGGLLGIIVVLALALAAIREASQLWAQAIFTLTLGGLAVATLAALLAPGRDGGGVGFSLFGWVSFLAPFGPSPDEISNRLLTNSLLEVAVHRLHEGQSDAVNTPPIGA